jgi:YesN/AraC family two-component response regulator
VSIKVIVADDQQIVRQGIASMLAGRRDRDRGRAANGVEAIEKSLKHRPNVLLMDVMMPEVDGLDALESCETSHRRLVW